MTRPVQTTWGLMPARRIPATVTLCAILVLVSLAGTLLERNLGMGTSLLDFRREALFDLQLWRLVTYAFVETQFLGLLLGVLILWIFGGWFEVTYGRGDYLRFFLLSSVGAALLAVPLSMVFNIVMPFQDDPGLSQGPDAALDAMLVAFALAQPNSTMLFGFVLPMRTRSVIFVILGLELVAGILGGGAALSITVGGMLMGYLLVTGMWRPTRLLGRIRMLGARRRRGLHVVPPRDPTLH